jgi:hypothetical protein
MMIRLSVIAATWSSIQATPKTPKPVPHKTIVETFPEGGFLIQGLQTRVAFKATNQYGNPVLVKGALVDDKNTVLDSLNVQHDGMGSFYLAPEAGILTS